MIFDEAHQLEDIMSDFFGVRVSHARIERLARDADRTLGLAGLGDPLLGGVGSARAVEELRAAEAEFWRELAKSTAIGEARVTLERDVWQGAVESSWHRLDSALEGLGALAESTRGRLSGPPGRTMPRGFDAGAIRDALDVCARRAEQLREHLLAIVDGAPGRVTWIDQGSHGRSLSSTPIDVSAVFRDRVLESVSAVILTSATLAGSAGRQSDSGIAGPFGFLRTRLGFSATSVSADELIVLSPFAFERCAILYTPRDLPPPRDQAFIEASAERIAELVEITGGGAFVLTTSLRSMRALHARLRARLGEKSLLLQGDAPKSALIGAFRASGDAVLVATTSFWEGVDVPGRALRLVVLEKIPFAVPSDPLVRARAMAIETEGGNPFVDYHVPAAAIALKQGFGRLIRSSTDARDRGAARRTCASPWIRQASLGRITAGAPHGFTRGRARVLAGDRWGVSPTRSDG